MYGVEDEKLKEIYNVYTKKERIFQLLDGLYVAAVPEYLPISAFVTIYVHPSFITVVRFPEACQILDANASFKSKRFVRKKNVIEIQPEKDFTDGNAVVYYKENGKVRMVVLIFKQINPYAKNPTPPVLYPLINLTDAQILSPFEVLEHYRRTYGRYPKEKFTEFTVGEIVYTIEKDAPYNNVRVGSTSYLVTASPINRR